MGLHEEHEESFFSDNNYKEDIEDLPHKKRVRRLLEDRLERKRLLQEMKDEFDEVDGEFDWSEFEK